MSDEMVVLVCERQCGHPDVEVNYDETMPQRMTVCPECGGPRVAMVPDEEPLEVKLEKARGGWIEIHNDDEVVPLTLAELVVLLKWEIE